MLQITCPWASCEPVAVVSDLTAWLPVHAAGLKLSQSVDDDAILRSHTMPVKYGAAGTCYEEGGGGKGQGNGHGLMT